MDFEVDFLAGEGYTTTIEGLRRSLVELAAPSYVAAEPLVAWEIARSNSLYRALSPAGDLLAFLLVGWGELCTTAGMLPVVYLGLGASRSDVKRSGVMRRLYSLCNERACVYEQGQGAPVWLWATTVAGSVYRGLGQYFTDVNPRPDGSFSAEAEVVIQAVRSELAVRPTDHPFVIRAEKPTRYVDSEYLRVQQLNCDRSAEHPIGLLRVDERLGDRLLVACRPSHQGPSWARLAEWVPHLLTEDRMRVRQRGRIDTRDQAGDWAPILRGRHVRRSRSPLASSRRVFRNNLNECFATIRPIRRHSSSE